MEGFDHKKIQLTPTQRKLAVFLGIFVAALFIFFQFIYIPQNNRYDQLRKELAATEREIEAITKIVGVEGEEFLAPSLNKMQARLKALNAKFNSTEESILRDLPNVANGHGVEIKTLQPQPKRVITEVGGAGVAIRGYDLVEIPVIMVAFGSYRSIGEYLQVLQEDFPALVKIRSLVIVRGDAARSGVLRADLALTVYFLIPSSKGQQQDG